MSEPKAITLELIYRKIEALHDDVRAMREEYAAIIALLRDINRDVADATRPLH